MLKTAISVASTACLCLLLLLVAVQHHRAQVDEETNTGSPAPLQDGAQPGSAQVKTGFSAYFKKLTRGRREAETPARSSAPAAEPPPAEDLSATDIFIAVKTTKKFHQSRLNLLLDTWVSRNMQQVNGKCQINSLMSFYSFSISSSSNAAPAPAEMPDFRKCSAFRWLDLIASAEQSASVHIK